MRALLAALVFLLMLTPAVSAEDLLSPEAFRDAAIAALRAAEPGADIEASDAFNVDVDYGDDRERMGSRVNLEHAYATYRANPTAMRDIIQSWVAFATQRTDVSMAPESIVSVVLPRDTIDRFVVQSAEARQRSGRTPSPVVWRPFVGDLAEALAFYNGDGVRLAVEESVTNLGLTVEQGWAAAATNLPSRYGQMSMQSVHNADRLFYISSDSGLAPSTLLNGAMCESRGRFAFLVATTDGYIAGDRDDPTAMGQFRSVLEGLRRSGRSASLTPLGCHQGRVVEITLTE